MSFRNLLSSLGLKGAEKRGEDSGNKASFMQDRIEEIEIPGPLMREIFPDLDLPGVEPSSLTALMNPLAENYEEASIQGWLLRREIERWKNEQKES